jgi:hypothetical protein
LDVHIAGIRTRRNQIEMAVAVQIDGCGVEGILADVENAAGLERAVAVAQEDLGLLLVLACTFRDFPSAEMSAPKVRRCFSAVIGKS